MLQGRLIVRSLRFSDSDNEIEPMGYLHYCLVFGSMGSKVLGETFEMLDFLSEVGKLARSS